MQYSSSNATATGTQILANHIATGTQILAYHKKVKGHPGLTVQQLGRPRVSNAVYQDSASKFFFCTGEEDFFSFIIYGHGSYFVHLNKLSTSLQPKYPCEIW